MLSTEPSMSEELEEPPGLVTGWRRQRARAEPHSRSTAPPTPERAAAEHPVRERQTHVRSDLVAVGARLHSRLRPRRRFAPVDAPGPAARESPSMIAGVVTARPMLLVAAALLVAWGLGLNLPSAESNGIHLLLIAAIAVAL